MLLLPKVTALRNYVLANRTTRTLFNNRPSAIAKPMAISANPYQILELSICKLVVHFTRSELRLHLPCSQDVRALTVLATSLRSILMPERGAEADDRLYSLKKLWRTASEA
jgi:hypothetical protein